MKKDNMLEKIGEIFKKVLTEIKFSVILSI